MKTLKQIREASGGKEAYQKFFNSLLKKFGVSSPSELKGDKKKEFYDAIDAGWEGDNEKPEKNETYGDPDNLDPDTTTDPDEEEINASYGKMNAGKMMASYHKESVNEAKKLKAGRGKAEIDINFDGDRKDIKFATTKYMVKIKPHRDGAIVTGDKAKILAYLQGQDYAMDPEDIEDLYPELMEGKSSPKPLSIIRQNKVSSDAVEEKMVMCEHCGKMHEEGGCAQSAMDMNDMDPETKGMEEAKAPRLSSAHKNQIHKVARKHSGNMEKAIKEIEKMKIWAGQGIKDNPYVMDVLRQHNEDVNEGVDVDRRTKGFKDAMIRQEKAKKVREKYKKKKEAKKDQAELDARYDYDGEVDTVLAAANYVLAGGKNEDAAANAVAHGGVDMAPNAGKKKKKKNLMARKY